MTERGCALAIALVLIACEGAPAESSPHEPAPPEDVGAFFPAAVGDRWRERVGEAARTRGITAATPEGLLVVFGQGDRRPAFHRRATGEIALTGPDGTVIEPLLRGPLTVGARFTYALGEGPGAAPCEAEIRGRDRRYAVGPIEGCVELRRECRHPAGLPFEAPTRRTTDETWCPGVGRVASETRLDPPLAGATAAPEARVVRYVIRGAPVPAASARFSCDDVLLLPSDVAAACGPRFSWVAERPLEDGCVHAFRAGDATLEVRVSRRASETDARDAARAILDAREGDTIPIPGGAARRSAAVALVTAHAGPHVIALEATDGCAPNDLARLLPLLRSVLPAAPR